LNLFPRKKIFSSRREARRRRWRVRLGFLAALLLVAGVAVFLANGLFDDAPSTGFAPLSEGGSETDGGSDPQPREGAEGKSGTGKEQEKAPPEEPAPDPEQKSPEAAAFVAVAPELRG
jgi:hypothetical protein